jgi:hypothetical protein
MAFFLIEHLQGAIEELGMEDYDPAAKLAELKSQEDADYERYFKESLVPNEPIEKFLNATLISSVDVNLPDMIHHAPAICHTSLIPSQIRYNGILTESDQKGMLDYEKGILKVVADKAQSQGPMRLIMNDAEFDPPCPVFIRADFKDYFYSNEKDGWTHLTFPNDSELQEYGPFQAKGLIMVCFVLCDWGKCPDGDIREPDLSSGKWQMKVNGEEVLELVPTSECAVMRHSGGYFFQPDSNGRFKLEVLVKPSEDEQKHYIRITSVIIF